MGKSISAFLLIFFLFIGIAFAEGQPSVKAEITAFQKFIGCIYTLLGGSKLKVAWDVQVSTPPKPAAEYFELRLRLIDKDFAYPIVTVQATDTWEYEFNQPRAGNFVVECRSCRANSVDPLNPFCSEWSISDDPTRATVDGNPMGWRVFWQLAKPSDLIIESSEQDSDISMSGP